MSEAPQTTASKPAKAPTVYHPVKLTDGREVQFPGNRQIQKEGLIDEATGTVAVRFDFRNGETRTFTLPEALKLKAACHGLSQKLGDEAAGEKDVDDAVLAIDAIGQRIESGEWFAPARAGGDGFSGASVVIQALAKVKGKTVADVKALLEAQVAKYKEKGLTRAALYKAYRNPETEVGRMIASIEAEKAAKKAGVSSEDLMADFEG